MNTLRPIRERDVMPELNRVELYLGATAKLLEQNAAADEVAYSVEGIDLAHNYQFPSRLAAIGENYSTLDIQTRLIGLDESDARVEGLRLCLHHYSLPISTTIELEQFDESTPLNEIPFAVIPSGCEIPTAKITLEDLLRIIDDLVQRKTNVFSNLSNLLDPRCIDEVSFAEITIRLLDSINKTAKRKRSRQRYVTHEPIITSDGGFVGEHTVALDIMRDTKETESYRLYVGVQQDIGDKDSATSIDGQNTVDYGMAMHHRPSTRVSAIRPIRGEKHSFHSELEIKATESTPATKDLLSTFERSLDELRSAKELL